MRKVLEVGPTKKITGAEELFEKNGEANSGYLSRAILLIKLNPSLVPELVGFIALSRQRGRTRYKLRPVEGTRI